MSELALYNIDRELKILIATDGLTVDVMPVLGDAHHKHRVREILQIYGVQTIYHAAAYKHVPIVEQNVVVGMSCPGSALNATASLAEAPADALSGCATERVYYPACEAAGAETA